MDEFIYPRLGAGHLYEKMANGITRQRGTITTGAKVTGIRREGTRIVGATIESADGAYDVVGKFFLASLPVTDLSR